MLKNAYLGAKIGFGTEKNELSEVGCAAGYQLYFYLLSSTQAWESPEKTLFALASASSATPVATRSFSNCVSSTACARRKCAHSARTKLNLRTAQSHGENNA